MSTFFRFCEAISMICAIVFIMIIIGCAGNSDLGLEVDWSLFKTAIISTIVSFISFFVCKVIAEAIEDHE